MSVLFRPSPVRQEDGGHRGGVRSRAQGRQHLRGGRHGECAVELSTDLREDFTITY